MDRGDNAHYYRGYLGKINEDRWLELDLYWFDKDNIWVSVNKFWQRYAPLFKDITVLAFNFLGDGLRDAANPYK